MSRSPSLLLAALLLSLGVASTPAWAGMTLAGAPKVTFFAVGNPGFLDIEGVTNQMTVADDGTKLTFTVPMATVETGIDLRDDHMNNKYVEVATYPNVVLTLDKASVTWPAAVGESASGTAKATFTIRDVTQPADVTYTVKKSKTGYKVNAKFTFDVSKHGIAVPSYLGVTVESAMRAEVAFDLNEG